MHPGAWLPATHSLLSCSRIYRGDMVSLGIALGTELQLHIKTSPVARHCLLPQACNRSLTSPPQRKQAPPGSSGVPKGDSHLRRGSERAVGRCLSDEFSSSSTMPKVYSSSLWKIAVSENYISRHALRGGGHIPSWCHRHMAANPCSYPLSGWGCHCHSCA